MAEAWLPLRIMGSTRGRAMRRSGISTGVGAVVCRSPKSSLGSTSSKSTSSGFTPVRP